MNAISSCARACARLSKEIGSAARKVLLRLQFPGIAFVGKVHISPNCDISVGRGARLRFVSCHIGRGATIIAGEDAEILIESDFIGPYSTIVARVLVHLGEGSKVAEHVTVRDANHDHRVPLRNLQFISAPVRVGSDVWLGAGSTVLAGTSIGSRATVGAGAVVTKDVAPDETVVGVPARPVGPS